MWSTEQVKSYFHHLQTKFVSFVFSETDYLTTLFDALREKYSNVYFNPRQEETKKNFVIRESTIVLRPSVTEEPLQDNFATIEKILVDLFLEKERLNLIDVSEYNHVFGQAIYSSRINIAVLLHYAKMRGVKNEIKSQIH